MIKINDNMDLVGYFWAVDSIVDGFFDDDGNYTPQSGHIKAAAVFYNSCISDTEYKAIHGDVLEDVLKVGELMQDNEFIECFNGASKFDGVRKLNFATAYHDALDIVDTKKTSIYRVSSFLKKSVDDIRVALLPLLDGNTLQMLSDALSAQNGGADADKVSD